MTWTAENWLGVAVVFLLSEAPFRDLETSHHHWEPVISPQLQPLPGQSQGAPSAKRGTVQLTLHQQSVSP